MFSGQAFRSIAPSTPAGGLSTAQVASMVFGLLGAVFIVWPAWRTWIPLEINRNEPWNAWFADAVLNGTPLYPSQDQLIVNNYPPLSFYITAAIAKLTGDTIVAGRLVSLASTVLVSIAAALCARAAGASRTVALLAGLWLFATLGRFFARYVGVDDPSLLGLALMGLALSLFLQRLATGRPVEPAIALMVAAGFVKHNMPAVPLAAFMWLAFADRRKAARALLFGAGLCLGGLLVCIAAYGGNFMQQMLTPREMSVAHMLTTINKLQWVAPALIFWGLWAWQNRKDPGAQFSALLLSFSLLSGIIQASGAGVTFNAYFEIVFAAAIALALAFQGIANTGIARRFGAQTIQAAMVALLILRLLLSQQLEPYLVLASAAFRNEIRGNVTAMDAETARIRAIPGAVSCSVMTVCYRAGKAFVYDDFWVGQLLAKHAKSKEEVDRAVGLRGIRFEQIDASALREKKRVF